MTRQNYGELFGGATVTKRNYPQITQISQISF